MAYASEGGDNLPGINPSLCHFKEQVNDNTITSERVFLTRLIKRLVTPYNRRRICQASRKKKMICLEPSDTSSSVVTMKSFISGKKITNQLQGTRASRNT